MSGSSTSEISREKGIIDVLKTWFSNSPSHGIRRISLADSIFGRIFWSFICLIFTSLMCFFILTVIRNYIAQPMKINLSIRQYQDSQYFPAITFCNLNPVRNLKVLNRPSDRPRPPRPGHMNRDLSHFVDALMRRQLTKNLHRKRPMVMESGYALDDLLIQCVFNGYVCHGNFTPFFHPNYGNCFTFDNDLHVSNIPQNETTPFWTMVDDESTDDGYKLFLELFLHQDDYEPSLDDRAAFRVFIHRKNQIPILSQNSLFLAPKTYTKLIFSQRIILFSHKCRSDLTDEMKEIFGLNSIRYSQDLCFKLCEFRLITIECNCTNRLLMVFSQFFNPNHTTHIKTNDSCSITNKCFSNRHRFNSIRYCPECLPECELIQYTTQSSYADYPNFRSMDKTSKRVKTFLKKINSTSYKNQPSCSQNRNEPFLDDIVAVGISASPYATEILSESPMYTWVDLISSIGGQTGLWIGVSLISFVEIGELLFLLLRHLMKITYRHTVNQ
ncbi:unnamed protein product [Adineta ricciae]|uniref:Uncharacterized protein n=1 Tax=Adineta ricciae TaxID=249248 RepID=A0A813SIV7_ADIRI|nr:unnamed protein product [Adineta ricciae]CAF1298488.1 unnamed protein product [Adineta ricciae]